MEPQARSIRQSVLFPHMSQLVETYESSQSFENYGLLPTFRAVAAHFEKSRVRFGLHRLPFPPSPLHFACMSKKSPAPVIRLRGVRHNNLKNFDLDLPQNQLIVITGLSGSGKSSLAFDTLFAEGQRRYIETFSPYARQFF